MYKNPSIKRVNIFHKILIQLIIIYQWIKTFFKQKQQLIIPVEKTHEEIYKQTIEFYKTMSHEEANTNIIEDLYDIEKRKLCLEKNDNEIEKQWTSRYLMENTKNSGNIIMHYDCFKMAFAYYSDTQTISNKDLYCAAMKYVVRFRCRDFLIDMDNFPDNKMIDLLREEDKQMKTKKKQVNSPINPLMKPLIANPNPNPLLTPKKIAINKQKLPPPHLFSTKFLRVGKICEFNIMKIPKNKTIEIVNKLLFSENKLKSTNNILDNLDISNDEVSLFEPDKSAGKLSSYAEWKKQQQ